jgi:hypothetical protein
VDEIRPYHNFAPFVRQTGESKAQTRANEILQHLPRVGRCFEVSAGRIIGLSRESEVAMKYALRLFALVAAVSVGATHAQTAALRVEKTIVSKSTFGSNDTLAGTGQCDSSGNIYVRVFDPVNSHQGSPVLMFDNAGALQTKFAGPHRAELQEGRFEFAFAVVPRGGIAVADWNYPDIHVVTFSPDGKVESDVQLDFARFVPYQLAVFPSGELFLSGIEDSNRDHPYRYKSFAAIYDKTGHLKKRLVLNGDEEIDRAIELGDSRYASFGPSNGNSAAAFGIAATGEDGNVYLVRRTSPAIVYVVSSAGEVVRKVVVEPQTSGDMPFEMQLAKGKLAFVFDGWTGSRSSGNSKLTIVDASNGERLVDFEGGVAGVGWFFGLSCYAPDSGAFTFLRMSHARHVEIITARRK